MKFAFLTLLLVAVTAAPFVAVGTTVTLVSPVPVRLRERVRALAGRTREPADPGPKGAPTSRVSERGGRARHLVVIAVVVIVGHGSLSTMNAASASNP